MTNIEATRHAAKQVVVHLGLQLCMFGAHALAAAWVALSVFDLMPTIAALPMGSARWLVAVWALGGLIWTPINARGLWQRRRWARRSTVYYWLTAWPLCCCIPIPTWAIW